tara:strand:- start:1861 stop:2220 length:360 start_codon:yes stop_codon:yes gene_type:complete
MGSTDKKTIVLPIPSAQAVNMEIIELMANFDENSKSYSSLDYYHRLNELAILRIIYERIRKSIFKAEGRGENLVELGLERHELAVLKWNISESPETLPFHVGAISHVFILPTSDRKLIS